MEEFHQESAEGRRKEEIKKMLDVLKETPAVKAFLTLSVATHMETQHSEDWSKVNDALMRHPDILLFTSLLKLQTDS